MVRRGIEARKPALAVGDRFERSEPRAHEPTARGTVQANAYDPDLTIAVGCGEPPDPTPRVAGLGVTHLHPLA